LTAAEAATKLIKAGNTNQQVTDAVAKVAEAYGVNAMQGTLMHQMKRYAFEGGRECAKKEGGYVNTLVPTILRENKREGCVCVRDNVAMALSTALSVSWVDKSTVARTVGLQGCFAHPRERRL